MTRWTTKAKGGADAAVAAGRARLDEQRMTARYGLVLILLLLSFLFLGISPAGRFGPLITLVIESVTLLMVLSAAGTRRRVMVCAIVASGLAICTGIVHTVHDSPVDLTFTSTMSALLVLVAPGVLARSVIRRRILDFQAVLAAIALYVMIGLFFCFVFSVIQAANAHHVFFAQGPNATSSDFLYFSFTVLTTVGFGDLTAAGGVGRTFSVFEAMLGQLYLVTVVALLVSNLGPAAARRRQLQGAGTAASPTDGAAADHEGG